VKKRSTHFLVTRQLAPLTLNLTILTLEEGGLEVNQPSEDEPTRVLSSSVKVRATELARRNSPARLQSPVDATLLSPSISHVDRQQNCSVPNVP
jgi:hypothetical protein